jgi:hypothetical protein
MGGKKMSIYLNMFEIELPDGKFKVMARKIRKGEDINLKDLRGRFKDKGITFYKIGNFIDAYGKGISNFKRELEKEGFKEKWLYFKNFKNRNISKLISHILKFSIIEKLKQNYEWNEKKFDIVVYEKNRQNINNNVFLQSGFKLRVIYLNVNGDLKFFLVVDRKFKITDNNDKPLSPKAIKEKFGEDIYNKVKIIQGEFKQKSIQNQNSTKSSKMEINENLGSKIYEDIKNFVSKIESIELIVGSGNLEAKIKKEPYHVPDENEEFMLQIF